MELTIELHHGNCLEVMKTIPDRAVSLIICDLPYGILDCEWDCKIDLKLFWAQVRRIRKDDTVPTLHFCNTRFGVELITSNPDEYRYDLVWSKSNAAGFLSANKKPMTSHEMIYVFSKAGSYYERIDITGNFPKGGGGRSSAKFMPIQGMPNTGSTKEGVRCVKSVIEIANKKQKGMHPTQKPVEIYEWLISRYSKEGDTVLDPTFGSGNSVLTAYSLNRNAIGIEMNKEFYDKACSRIPS